jgi:hypothetical protein
MLTSQSPNPSGAMSAMHVGGQFSGQAPHEPITENKSSMSVEPEQFTSAGQYISHSSAESVDVGLRTIQRWVTEPGFAAAYREARTQAFSQAIALTQRYAPLAVNALARILMDQKAPSSSVVSAASAMLKFGREGIELEDLAVRVESLEQAAKEQGIKPGGSRPSFN